jgi:hypothetical protein
VQAQLKDASSVLMAEAGALALAARIVKLLNLTEVNHISDNAPFVNILTGRYRGLPHDWKTKPLVIVFQAHNTSIQHQIFKSTGLKK